MTRNEQSHLTDDESRVRLQTIIDCIVEAHASQKKKNWPSLIRARARVIVYHRSAARRSHVPLLACCSLSLVVVVVVAVLALACNRL